MPVITQEILRAIRKIQIQTTHLAEDVLAGSWHSAFKGKGIEFEEVREYQPGDDIRNIDWKVTARMNDPYVKSYREERELTVMLLVDVSASSRFGSKNRTKADLAAEIGGVLAFSALKNHDKVGLILFSDKVELYLPPKKGQRHVFRVIRELLVREPENKGTDIGAALAFLGRVQRKRGICFLISDFFCKGFDDQLKLLSKRHDMIGISVTDPYERTFPFVGLINTVDLESGQRALVDPSNERDAYLEEFKKRRENLNEVFKKSGAGYIAVSTDQPYIPALKRFFRLRKLKR